MTARKRKASLEETVGLGRLRFFGPEDEHARVDEPGHVDQHKHVHEPELEHKHVQVQAHVHTAQSPPLPAPPARATEARSVHLHVLLTPTASRQLRELADTWGVSQGEVLRFAIDLTWRIYLEGGGGPQL